MRAALSILLVFTILHSSKEAAAARNEYSRYYVRGRAPSAFKAFRSGVFFSQHFACRSFPGRVFQASHLSRASSLTSDIRCQVAETSRAVLLSRPAGSRIPSAHRAARAGQKGRSRGVKTVYGRDKEKEPAATKMNPLATLFDCARPDNHRSKAV